jgi:hypothetical protein
MLALMHVAGSGWNVRHPRNDGDPFYFSFGFPMTQAQAIDAVNRGGLGWAPSLDVALRNAVAALSSRQDRQETP